MLSIHGLTNEYKESNFKVMIPEMHFKEGSIIGLLGKNGAGKTTILEMIAGLINPDKGLILINDSKQNFSSIGYMEEDPYLSLSLGFDRSWFEASLYGYLEYHYSSPGSNRTEDYPEVESSAPFTAGGVYLLGNHYLCPGVTWNPAPLWTFSSTALASLSDGSCFLSLSGEYAIGQNTALQAGGNLGLGRAPARDGTIRSEFGSWPDLLYLRVGYYF